jgi:hypothetical protein
MGEEVADLDRILDDSRPESGTGMNVPSNTRQR